VDFGPPPQPIDPVACPAARLEQFAARIGAPLDITTEQIVDAERVDKLPCKTGETDDACLARARQRAVPTSYEFARVTLGAENTTVDFTFELDGRITSDRAESPKAMTDKLKALQAAGHKVTMLGFSASETATARHAAIAYRGIGGRKRRIATIKLPETTSRDDIEQPGIEIRSVIPDEAGTLVATFTCAGI